MKMMVTTLKYHDTGTWNDLKRWYWWFQHFNKSETGLFIVVIWMPSGHINICNVSPPLRNCHCPTVYHHDGRQIFGPWRKENERAMQFPNSQIGPDSFCVHRPTLAALRRLSQIAPHSPSSNCHGGNLFKYVFFYFWEHTGKIFRRGSDIKSNLKLWTIKSSLTWFLGPQ